MNKTNENKKNIFTDLEHFRTIDVRRIIYFITFGLSFVLTELGRFHYRPYIYENNINDFGLADSMGNLGGILVQVFFGLALFNSPKKKGFNLILFFVLGYILYEIVQPLLPKGVFDWLDIYGTVLGGVIALGFYMIINALVKNSNKVIHRF